MKKNIAIFLLFLCASGVMSQCHQVGEACDDGAPCCAGAGVCRAQDYGPSLCLCLPDSWWSSCSDSSECCGSSSCNTRGYCGCISSGFYCTSGYDNECCGTPSSTDGHLIKTCTYAWPLHHECY